MGTEKKQTVSAEQNLQTEGHQPYIPHTKTQHELTPGAIIIGILLAVVFGAANAYLGLKVGLTISASIPAAVMSLGIMRGILRRGSVLESNIVQTIGSAGESVAAGIIFTIPALFLWADEGKMQVPSIWEITLIAVIGGILGVFYMVPLRNALIVKEHHVLPYPEGTACAEVLLSAEQKGSHSGKLFVGMGIGAVIKFLIDGLRLIPGEITYRIRGYYGEFGTQIYPAVISVGYICGPKIALNMFAGGVLSWLVLIPMIVFFGQNITLHPANVPIMELYQSAGASGIWSSYIRYIGAGALAAAGIISLIRSLPLIINTFREAIFRPKKTSQTEASVQKQMRGAKSSGEEKEKGNLRTEQSLSPRLIVAGILLLTFLIWFIPILPVNLFGALIIVVFGFFFATVSSRLVGMVGSSNNPASGMVIATLLIATVLLKFTGQTGAQGMHSAMAIASVICIVVCVAGDTSQDLKTGYILGATPRKQQIGELIGVVASALTSGAVLYLLNRVWPFGSDDIPAPQASLMKLITEGVMENNIPWTLVFIGAFITLTVTFLGIPALSFAIGLYLPVHLSSCVMIGGVIRWWFGRKKTKEQKTQDQISDGTLICSGMIAGEGLFGILIALLAVTGLGERINLSDALWLSDRTKLLFSILLLIVTVGSIVLLSQRRGSKQDNLHMK